MLYLEDPARKMNSERKLQMMLFNHKAPLEKSLSMPDIQIKAKNRERFRVYVSLL